MDPQDDSLQNGDAEAGVDRARVAALEARVVRLELALAAFEQITGQKADAVRVVPPPPPPVRIRPALQQESAPVWPFAEARVRPPILHAATQADSRASFEDRLGSQIFNRIAIVLLLIGTAYGLKLAVDRGLIGPAGRVLLGLLAGAGLVVWSERFRRKGFAAFSYSLKAVGSGVLYLSLWAAFQIFHLLPAAVALTMMVLVTAWNAYMAWAQDSELLAVYALAGAVATPLLVSTGGNHEIFLFTYLLAIDIATITLVRLKAWPRLLLGAFPKTVLFFIGWYSEFYAANELTVTAIYILLFGLVFASVAVGDVSDPSASEGDAEQNAASSPKRNRSLAIVVQEILLPLANAAFVALAFYSILQDAGHHAWIPWLMLALAAAYLALMRAPQTRTASAIHLSLAVMLLTIAIPLKASGHWITVSWLVEGLALEWVAIRLSGSDEQSYASRTLGWLAMGSLALGFAGVANHCFEWIGRAQQPLFNSDTGTALVGMAVFAAAGWLASRSGEQRSEAQSDLALLAMGALSAIGTVALLLTLREVAVSWVFESFSNPHLPLRSADFLAALAGLAVFAALVGVSLRLARSRADLNFWQSAAALATIAFNVIAVLTGVREVSAFWNSSAGAWSAEGALQQALAISAFLMMYGAALLAAGFWKRSGFLRWQALLLLVLTIFKTFLYDMRSLSQGYRVASVLGLGVLLMAISYAYQKDWLNLREADPEISEAGTDTIAGSSDKTKGRDPEVVR